MDCEQYLASKVTPVLNALVADTLRSMPEDPAAFMLQWLERDSSLPEPIPGYELHVLRGGSINPVMQDAIYSLLLGYGPHYPHHFGPDMKSRMEAPSRHASGADGILCTALTLKGSSEVVAHASVIFDPSSREVGLFGAVFTHPAHRGEGLSKLVCRACIHSWDKMAGDQGSVLVLGTGSPYAASVYQKEGFSHLNGGLSTGACGYNPDDQGEWIMLRWRAAGGLPPRNDLAAFRAAHYSASTAADDFSVVPLARRHWAGLVLLLTAFPGEGKLLSAGIHDGLEAEERLVELINAAAASSSNMCLVALHRTSGCVHGFAVALEEYVAPCCAGAFEALLRARQD